MTLQIIIIKVFLYHYKELIHDIILPDTSKYICKFAMQNEALLLCPTKGFVKVSKRFDSNFSSFPQLESF